MIGIEEEGDLLKVHIVGEFTLGDFEEFEQAVSGELKLAPKLRLLLDLRQMAGFTVDMAWEDIKFTREHTHDFRRIAVVTHDQWIAWLSWLNAAFTDAELAIFVDLGEAVDWVKLG
jgi:hypothetical protein